MPSSGICVAPLNGVVLNSQGLRLRGLMSTVTYAKNRQLYLIGGKAGGNEFPVAVLSSSKHCSEALQAAARSEQEDGPTVCNVHNRDRGSHHLLSPPTLPDMRVRIRRSVD
jgi:hypothetical protein